MSRKLITLILALVLALSVWGGMPAQKAQAALTSITMVYWPSHIPMDASDPCTSGGGTAYGMYVTVVGDLNQNFVVNTAMGGTGCTWNPVTGVWVPANPGNFNQFPRYNTGSTGTISVWIYGRIYSGTPTSQLSVGSYPCDASWLCFGGPEARLDSKTVTKMDMTTQGGWLEETGEAGRQGRTIVVKSGSTIRGIYIAEDNLINEGYGYAAGGYKVAAPICTNCGYTIETWLSSNPGTPEGLVNTMGANGCPSDITAGGLISLDSCNNPTAIHLESFTGSGRGRVSTILLISLALILLTAGVFLNQKRRARL